MNNVKELQHKIAVAYQSKNMNLVKQLQQELINSESAIRQAVCRIVRSNGAYTPGIDKFIINSPAKFNEAVNYLRSVAIKPMTYKSQPVRRVEIPKPGTDKMRPIGIPTIFDRCVQQLFLFTLAPIAEVGADSDSYGFRINRGTQDAVYAAQQKLHNNYPRMIYDADISKFFDSVSHE